MQILKGLAGVLALCASHVAIGQQTPDVSIGQISTRRDSSYTRIQIIGNNVNLGCSNNNYVLLSQLEQVQYDTSIAMVMTAYSTGRLMVFITDQCATFNSTSYALARTVYLQH